MKARRIATVIAVLAGMAMGCKKVEDVAPQTHSLLPLAVGNEWVFVDSFFTTTSLPSSDTLVREVSYRVTRRKRTLETHTGQGDHEIQRYEAWEVVTSDVPDKVFTYIVDSAKVFGPQPFYQLLGLNNDQCNEVRNGFEANVPVLYTENEAMYPGLVEPSNDTSAISLYPIFQDLPQCIPGLGPTSQIGVQYSLPIFPVHVDATIVPVTSPAGVFGCQAIGNAYWAPGVGLVRVVNFADAAFLDTDFHAHTGQLTWSRTLKSYTLH
ncbi:MAG: hypothetical protein U0176_05545 [Bacteroidia bacterium]